MFRPAYLRFRPSRRATVARSRTGTGLSAGPALPTGRVFSAGRVLSAGRVFSAGLVLLAGAVFLAGCGTPPELAQPRGAPVPSPSQGGTPTLPASGVPPTSQTTVPSTSPAPTFGEFNAVDCAGRPSGSQVISFLRRDTRLLPSGSQVTVSAGPLCAGDWQYTVLQVPNREPLQVVTSGSATNLRLVTAGTNVCNAAVRATAPYGIRTVACEGGIVAGL